MRADNSTPRVQEQSEQFDEVTGGYSDYEHNRAAKRINADMRAMDATPRAGHTPGPWTLDRRQSMYGDYFRTLGTDGKPIDERLGSATGEANARLMASAPDLLEACKDAVMYLDPSCEECPSPEVLLDVLRAAIARATT
jgi:hypothetical protein